jgi:hypothetical protein
MPTIVAVKTELELLLSNAEVETTTAKVGSKISGVSEREFEQNDC